MIMTVPVLHAVKPSRAVRAARRDLLIDLSDDPTEYPDGEPMARDPVESNIADKLGPVIARYEAERGVVCYTGSDNFIYYRKGNNEACVSPDLYTLPGVKPSLLPRKVPGSKDEGSWKTWLLGVVPNFALEVKAFGNPRKDELQSPKRHDALGTKELIVFDPFAYRRRRGRKRFCVMRRNEYDVLVTVLETNDDRVYSQAFDAYIVAEGEGDESLLRLGLGPNGERLLPFDSEIIEMQSRRVNEETRLRQEEARLRQEESRLRQEEARRADEESRLRQEEARRADEEARRADEEARRAGEEARRADEEARMRQEEARLRQEETRRADEAMRAAADAARRAAELEAEIARLRAGTNQTPKRVAKGKSPRK